MRLRHCNDGPSAAQGAFKSKNSPYRVTTTFVPTLTRS